MAAPLSSWPWQNLASYKYLLYGPFIAQVVYSRIYEQGSMTNMSYWCLHLLILWTLRGCIHQLFSTFSNMLFLNQSRRINRHGVDFAQVDHEWDWDNFLILQAFIATTLYYYLIPSLEKLPLWNTGGVIAALLLHVGFSEPLYYFVHRFLHRNNYFFTNYHSLHHQSTVLQPYTSGNATLLEHLVLAAIVGVPVIVPSLFGNGSFILVYGYVMAFDFLRCFGHCNVEVVPHQIFDALPFLRYIIYTPTKDMAAPLSSWPWQNLASYKYLLYGPFIAQVVYSRIYEQGSMMNMSYWCLHLLILWTLRGCIHQLFSTFSNMLFLNQSRRINHHGVDFAQVDHEWDWDNFLILQAFIATTLYYYLIPSLEKLPLWNTGGVIAALLLHVGFSEPLYYFVHRFLHRNNYFFTNYHSLHHQSTVLQPYTSGNATLLEHLVLAAIVGVPVIVPSLFGNGSFILVYGYVMAFDFLRCFGHCNVEVVPHQVFDALPFLRYIIYTPTYHSLHHQEMDTNFCLFMPVFDAIGNTINTKSWELHKKITSQTGKDVTVPGFVFLAHVVDISSSMHAPFVLRSYASLPFSTRLFQILLLPIAITAMLALWSWAKTFTISFYNLRGRLHQTWSVPRFGFQYFLPFAAEGINKQIEDAILKADRLGVKVISLAALNKNEALNGGGTLFVNKHKDLRVRVVHGNTLTAAVILNDLPKDVTEVFLTGSTSKLGRAIALYLCQRKVRVLMLTQATERFQMIQKEAPLECQQYLVQVTKYQAAKHCKTWIVGKWINPREQNWAPPGAHFHQFVVPPILQFRRDCTYGDLAAMRLPNDVQGLGSCEYTMERGVVHACHAGGVVHFLEGWTHHEVGAIDVDRIDIVWEAAMKHGFKPISDTSSV